MKTRINLCTGLFAMAITAVGCGPNLTAVPPGAATGPTTLEPLLLPRLDGVWGGDMMLTGIAEGAGPARDAGSRACAGAAFDLVVGETINHSLSIKQDGTSLTARLTSAGTGLACTYNGRVGSNGGVVLDATTCETSSLVFRCPDGQILQMALVSSSITATIDAPVRVTSITGTAAHTYNVTGGGGQDQGFVANHSFIGMTRR